jgi:hypothetical protein
MVGTKVYLELYVKVEAGWRESRRFIDELDWRRQLEFRMQEMGAASDPKTGSGND